MGYALGAWLCSSLAYVFVEYFYPHKRLQAVVVLMVIVNILLSIVHSLPQNASVMNLLWGEL